MTAECLLIVIILNLNFVKDFEAEVWSRFRSWVFIKLLGEALTLVRTLSPLVHCAFAMFLFGSLVSLAMLLFWRLYIKQADESAFPPLLSSSSWCKPLFWNNSQLGRNHSSPNYPTSQIFGKKTCSVKVFVVVKMGLSWWQSVEKMMYCNDQTVMKLQRKEHNILWGKLFPSLLFPHESVCGRSQTGAVPWYMASLQPTRGRAHWEKEKL